MSEINAKNQTEKRGSEDIRELQSAILRYERLNLPLFDYLKEISGRILKSLDGGVVQIRLIEGNQFYLCESFSEDGRPFTVRLMQGLKSESGRCLPCLPSSDHPLENAIRQFIEEASTGSETTPIRSGRFLGWNPETDSPVAPAWMAQDPYPFAAAVLLKADKELFGVMLIKKKLARPGASDRLTTYESLASTISAALAHQRALSALRERIKELTCLYGISKAAAHPGASLDEILGNIVNLLPPAWQYPDITTARITLGDRSFLTPRFREGLDRQASSVIINGNVEGMVEVFYVELRPQIAEGPFLREERNLIDGVAWQIAVIVERKRAEEERRALEKQLQHADRLATIGQLAAGVAHELNEPLGSVLGFAQLVLKNSGLPKQAESDVERIVSSALHAREIVRKLLIFARQAPSKKVEVNLNETIRTTLTILEHRFEKEGIRLVQDLGEIPNIIGDRAQLTQVAVNLVVNAMQAMPPTGGRIFIRTRNEADWNILEVEDNGVGMSEEVRRKIFLPFFTTKDVREGTGLGLSVVHGIVSSHGGTIRVQSREGQGSCFCIELPLKPMAGKGDADDAG